MIRNNRKRLLLERYHIVGDSTFTFKEFVEHESKSDPNFFRWFFGDNLENDFDLSLKEEERIEFQRFLTEIDYN